MNWLGNLVSLWAGRETLHLYAGRGINSRENDGRTIDDRTKDVVPVKLVVKLVVEAVFMYILNI